jgi:hypothetical protein
LGGLLLCLRVITVNPALVPSDNPGQEGCIIGDDLTNLLTDVDTLLLLISCQKSHQARYITSNKRTQKSARPHSCVKLCTLTPICYYYHLLLHHTTTTDRVGSTSPGNYLHHLVQTATSTVQCK